MEPKKIILHIGHGKTGSSYLQSCFALNRAKLLKTGIDYPKCKTFSRALKGEVTGGNGNVFLKNILDLNAKKERVVYSSERLFNHLPNSTQFKNLLESRKYQFEVLLYTRNLFELRFSSWGQSVKRRGNTKDLSAFLLKRPSSPHHQRCLEWVELSEQFNFKLLIRNYSNHKRDLAQRFFGDLTGRQDFSLELPQSKNVNRSLTSAELNIQRVINMLDLGKPYLSDDLVNNFPNLKSAKLKCSRDAYDVLVAGTAGVIASLNKYLPSDEMVRIETPEEVAFSEDELHDNTLSQDQVRVVAEFLSRRLSNENVLK